MSDKSFEITGNKGEWSELYAFVKLLADGKLYIADNRLEKKLSRFFPILKIVKEEGGIKKNYIRNGNVRIVKENGEELAVLPIADFRKAAKTVFESIKNNW